MCLFACCCSESRIDESLLKREKRSCTDCLFLLIFMVFCAGLIVTTVYGFIHGDAYKVLYGSDSFGNTCGRKNEMNVYIQADSSVRKYSGQDMTDKKFMFPLNISNPFDSLWVCVEECPRETILTGAGLKEYCAISSEYTNPTQLACPRLPILKSVSLLHRCVPQDVLSFGQELMNKIVQLDFLRSYLNDLLTAYPLIIKSFAMAMVISFISIYFLRFFAGIVVYFIYGLVVVVAAGISAAFWYSFYLIQVKESVQTTMAVPTRSSIMPEVQLSSVYHGGFNDWFTLNNIESKTMFALSLGATVITIFTIVVVWCLLPRGKDVVQLFERASRALSAMPILLLQPILSTSLVLCLAIFSLSSVFVLLTAGEPVFKEVIIEGSTIIVVENNVTETVRLMVYLQLIGFVWISEFILACQRLFIAGSVSLWYFKSKGIREVSSPVCNSFYNLHRYHLGSAALGSLIITIVRIPRYILMWTYAKMKAIENPIAKKLLACFIIILSCIEKCLNYLNYNAYTVISYSGMSFCPAAKLAVNTLLDNVVGVASVNTVGSIVLFLTKFIVASITTVISFYIFKDIQTLAHPVFPFIIIFIISYLIANCFLSILEMALDSLLLCHLEFTHKAEQTVEFSDQNMEMQPLRND